MKKAIFRPSSKRAGFTLIELLVVIAIIGLLSTLAVIALGTARAKARDAKRVSDIKQIQSALELYNSDKGGYPSVGTAVALGGTATKVLCDTAAGFQADSTGCTATYMGRVPANPTPNGADYNYCSATSAAPTTCAAATTTYKITFNLEGATGGLVAGTATATPSGITQP